MSKKCQTNAEKSWENVWKRQYKTDCKKGAKNDWRVFCIPRPDATLSDKNTSQLRYLHIFPVVGYNDSEVLLSSAGSEDVFTPLPESPLSLSD
jgi:hypothetical protein